MWVTSLGLAGEAGIFASLPFYPMFSGVPNGLLRLSPPQVHAAVHNSGVINDVGEVTVTMEITAGGSSIVEGGIRNGASFLPGAAFRPSDGNGASVKVEFPGGAIAAGSIFSIFGTGLGPAEGVTPPALLTTSIQTCLRVGVCFPLETELGGVSVSVFAADDSTVEAIPVFVRSDQINAIMPSSTPQGEAFISVLFNGAESPGARVQVVRSAIGIFTGPGGQALVTNFSAPGQPLNRPDASAQPGEFMVAWATGVGPIAGSDQVLPFNAGKIDHLRDVNVFVGGKQMSSVLNAGRYGAYPGVDLIVFLLDDDVTEGCAVPMVVEVDGIPSNVVNLSIAERVDPPGVNRDRGDCEDDIPAAALAREPGRYGVLQMVRIAASVDTAALTDITAKALNQYLPSGPAPLKKLAAMAAVQGLKLAAQPIDQNEKGTGSLTPIRRQGTDMSVARDIAFGSFAVTNSGLVDTVQSFVGLPPMGGCASSIDGDIDEIPDTEGPDDVEGIEKFLDAGESIDLKGPLGDRVLERQNGSYQAFLGGVDDELNTTDLFLQQGLYEVIGQGGEDVGPFQASALVGEPINITNVGELGAIDVNKGATVRWAGGNPSMEMGMLIMANFNLKTGRVGTTTCAVDLADGSFTVNPIYLRNLPLTIEDEEELVTLGLSIILATPKEAGLTFFEARGIEAGAVSFSSLSFALSTFTSSFKF